MGELALGRLRHRALVLTLLGDLPQASVATDSEVLSFIDSQRLKGFGIGYVDAHLLATVRLTLGVSLWTRDRRLPAMAVRLGVAARVAG